MEEAQSHSDGRLILRIARGQVLFVSLGGNGIMPQAKTFPINGTMSIAANLRRIITEQSLDASMFESITVLIDAPVMLIPIEEYSADEAPILYHYAFTESQNLDVVNSVMPSENTVALIGVNKDLYRVLTDNFSEVKIVPLMQSLWHYLHHRNFTGTGQKIFVYFHERRMEICSFHHSRFRYQNNFEPASAADATYYIMDICHQLAFKPSTDEIHLLGLWNHLDETEHELQRFVSHIHKASSLADIKIPQSINPADIPLDTQSYICFGR